jgi:hypothetical protein
MQVIDDACKLALELRDLGALVRVQPHSLLAV